MIPRDGRADPGLPMRRGACILLSLLCFTGCAARHAPSPPEVAQLANDQAATTASLVFEPPLVASEPPVVIPRAGRAPAAYAGFEEIISTYYYLRVDDRQLDYNGHSHDRFERRAITTRVGVTHR